MSNAIYYSKVEFIEFSHYFSAIPTRVVLLNVVVKELSYQVIRHKRQMPSLEGIKTIVQNGGEISIDIAKPGRIIRNSHNGFDGVILSDDIETDEIVFSYGMSIPKNRMEKLLSLCNALDFEPYRDKEPNFDDEGIIGYRDEISMRFRGITDSHIPLLELDMRYYYDKDHIWPPERLYCYWVKNFLENNRHLKGWGPHYGGLSLFG